MLSNCDATLLKEHTCW